MRVAAVQFDIAWEDKPANHRRLDELLDDANLAPDTFVLLPELGDTGFSFNLNAIVDDQSLDWAINCARVRQIWLQAGFARRGDDGRGRNVAAIISPDGDVLADYEKLHPFSFGKEADHFSGGDRLSLARCGDATVCPLICYDLRFPEAWRLGALAGADVFTIGASWPAARQHHWRTLQIARAIENQAYVVAVNRTGSDPHIKYVGGSIIVSPMGDILAEAGDEEIVLTAELDLPALDRWRANFPALVDIRRDLLGSINTNAPKTR